MSKQNVIKKDIIDYLYNKIGFPRKELSTLVDDIFLLMGYALVKEKKLLISTFGTFEVKHKKERVVFNPRTKEPNKISARNVINFQASRKFRDYLMDK